VSGLLLGLGLSACPGAPECALLEKPADEVSVDRAKLERLLDEPEFSRVRKRNANVFAVLAEQFFAWLKKLFETEGAARFAKATPFFVLTAAFAVAGLALLRFVRIRRGPASAAGAPGAEPLLLRPAPEHLANARRLLASAPREAIREALLALLSSLERRRLARPDRVKTNREVCAELPGRGAEPALVRDVEARVDWYDRIYYSLAPVPADEARAFIDDIARLAT
jgi:hypothetical protein